MCALAYTKGLWSESSAGREETVELIRSVLNPLYKSIENKTGEKSTPILYQKVSVTMDFFAEDAEFSHNLFALTFEKLHKISREEGCRPLVDALYGAAALFIGLDDPTIEAFMKHSVDDAWEYAFFQNNPGAGQAVNKAVSRKKRRKTS